MAKAVELRFLLKAEQFIEKEPAEFSQQQKTFLANTKEILDDIKNLYEFYDAYSSKHYRGSEYCLGHDLFHHLPEKDLDKLREHLAGLLN